MNVPPARQPLLDSLNTGGHSWFNIWAEPSCIFLWTIPITTELFKAIAWTEIYYV